MRFGFSLFLLVLSGPAWSAAHATYRHQPLVKVSDIRAWTDRNVQSVEKLLETLPEGYRNYATFQFSSRSQHHPTTVYPRIIFFGPDARLFTAVSTNPKDPRFQVVEFLEFDPVLRRYDPYAIDFARPAAERWLTDTAICHTCHHPDLRPNWEPYDLWPGTFGSLHDTIPGGTKQSGWYVDLVKLAKTDPRLKWTGLKDSNANDASLTYYSVSRAVGSNGALSVLLGFANRERIADRLIHSAQHAEYRFAIAAALAECDGDLLDYLPEAWRTNHPLAFAAVETQVRDSLTAGNQDRLARALLHDSGIPEKKLRKEANHYGLRAAEVRRVAGLSYLLENRRVGKTSMEDWATLKEDDPYAFNDGASGLENLIGHYAPLAFADRPDVLAALPIKEVPFDATSYSAYDHGPQADMFPVKLYELQSNRSAFCALLRKR